MHQTDLGFLFNKVTRQVRLMFAEGLADTGLTPQQASVLMAVARSREGMLTPRAVAESIDADAPTTSGVLERLSRDGWLVSEPNPGDRRSRLVSLSAKAEKALPAVLAAAERVSEEATACLSAREVARLTELLAMVCAADSARTTARKGGAL